MKDDNRWQLSLFSCKSTRFQFSISRPFSFVCFAAKVLLRNADQRAVSTPFVMIAIDSPVFYRFKSCSTRRLKVGHVCCLAVCPLWSLRSQWSSARDDFRLDRFDCFVCFNHGQLLPPEVQSDLSRLFSAFIIVNYELWWITVGQHDGQPPNDSGSWDYSIAGKLKKNLQVFRSIRSLQVFPVASEYSTSCAAPFAGCYGWPGDRAVLGHCISPSSNANEGLRQKSQVSSTWRVNHGWATRSVAMAQNHALLVAHPLPSVAQLVTWQWRIHHL